MNDTVNQPARMFALLRSLLPLLNVAGLVLVARRRRVLRSVRSAQADDESRAIDIDNTGLTGWWLRRLAADGVLKRTAGGRYWLDRDAYGRYRRVRMMRAAVVLVIVGTAALLMATR